MKQISVYDGKEEEEKQERVIGEMQAFGGGDGVFSES
jgi:hypothetical protein